MVKWDKDIRKQIIYDEEKTPEISSLTHLETVFLSPSASVSNKPLLFYIAPYIVVCV